MTIELRNVGVTYPRRARSVEALTDVNLLLREGELLAVRGASGCGKSTLLMTIGGMLRPTRGTVFVGGQDLYTQKPSHRALLRRRDVGFVFQMFHLLPYLSVLDNVLLGANRDQSAEARMLLDRLGLGDRIDHKPHALSAGESQRAALARAMLKRPRLILADEPTGNLDPENALEVFRLLRGFRDGGGTVVVVTHGSEAERFADRTIYLRAGRIVEQPATHPVA